MPPANDAVETILIVDDEETVRKTFREWLEGANLGCRILAAPDAESALVQANQHVIDLAVLDWNLGAGNDGLQLLEDLSLFNPDVVAILVTGYAQEATPLDAMRMGVRDYLDKSQDLDRTTFLRAVHRQLDRIRPARRERRLHRELAAFRAAVEKVLPLVQAAAALNDPPPLPQAVRSLFRFLVRTTGAAAGVLLVRSYDAGREPPEVLRAYDEEGQELSAPPVPFARSIAGSVVSVQEPCLMNELDQAAKAGNVELQPFERGRRSLLAAPLNVAPGLQVVLELFDKAGPPDAGGGFGEADRLLASAAADFGAEMLRQALAENQTHRVLFDAVEAALGASESMAATLRGSPAGRPEDPPPAEILEPLRQGWHSGTAMDSADTLRLAEAIRVLALRHGSPAVRHCTQLVEGLRRLLDEVTGAGEARP